MSLKVWILMVFVNQNWIFHKLLTGFLKKSVQNFISLIFLECPNWTSGFLSKFMTSLTAMERTLSSILKAYEPLPFLKLIHQWQPVLQLHLGWNFFTEEHFLWKMHRDAYNSMPWFDCHLSQRFWNGHWKKPTCFWWRTIVPSTSMSSPLILTLWKTNNCLHSWMIQLVEYCRLRCCHKYQHRLFYQPCV